MSCVFFVFRANRLPLRLPSRRSMQTYTVSGSARLLQDTRPWSQSLSRNYGSSIGRISWSSVEASSHHRLTFDFHDYQRIFFFLLSSYCSVTWSRPACLFVSLSCFLLFISKLLKVTVHSNSTSSALSFSEFDSCMIELKIYTLLSVCVLSLETCCNPACGHSYSRAFFILRWASYCFKLGFKASLFL